MSREIVQARATGGKVADRKRTVRVSRYPDSWSVILGIGGADPQRQARASAELDPGEAREVARHLLVAADRSEEARQEARGA